MTDTEERLQLALARLVGQIRSGGAHDARGHNLERNQAFVDADALLEALDTPADVYRYRWPRAVPVLQPVVKFKPSTSRR